MEQRSDEWLEWRLNGIGSSDAAIIMGTSRFKSLTKLFNEKWKKQSDLIPISEAMQKGIDLEEYAVERLQTKVDKYFYPYCQEHSEYPFIRASFDGITLDDTDFCEIKCTSIWNLHKWQDEDDMPPYYYTQMQHQMLVNGLDGGWFYAISYDDTSQDYLKRVPRNDLYIDELLRREIIFWDHVTKNIKPPKDIWN